MTIQSMSPEEAALEAELDADGLPPELESEKANKRELNRPDAEAELEDAEEELNDAAEVLKTAKAEVKEAAKAVHADDAPEPEIEAATETAQTEPDNAAQYRPAYEVNMPADAADQVKTLRVEKADAFDKLMDGEMTAAEYRAIETRTDDSVDAIRSKVLTANVLAAANEQQAQAEWQRNEQAEFTKFKAEGLDYRAKPGLLAAYNTHLKSLAALPENETKDAGWFLRKAHEMTKEELGIKPTAAAKPEAKPRGVDRSAIPPTLSRTPPAADPAIAGDEFAGMQGLKGSDAERAFAKMTPEQQERYLDG